MEINWRALVGGVFLALSLVIIDHAILNFGNLSSLIFGFEVPLNLLVSSAFAVSLGGGYMVGKAYVEDLALGVLVYGGSWVMAMITCFFGIGVEEIPLNYLLTGALFIGGAGLFAFRATLGTEHIDLTLISVLTVATLLNLIYFFWSVT